MTYREYAVEVRDNLHKFHDQLKTGKYRAQPLRRIYIPKEDGRQRPISIPSLEDKIVQKAAADLLSLIWSRIFWTVPTDSGQAAAPMTRSKRSAEFETVVKPQSQESPARAALVRHQAKVYPPRQLKDLRVLCYKGWRHGTSGSSL